MTSLLLILTWMLLPGRKVHKEFLLLLSLLLAQMLVLAVPERM
ncbi:hypothetical protein FGIG_11469 [Fasciola gigantica]|uniref:Uncharacterized protein n=1 Tax=Fasciola gigantica TaxID=46835 RepID=A0A504YB71_FASGI|nr:hypothetical protein FGIG_11469 [Fasciola gigantica]